MAKLEFDVKKYIHESNLIENINDPEFDKQSLAAWNYLKKQKELTHGVIQKVQKMITLLQPNLQPHHRGYYRSMAKVDVYVGGEAAPSWTLVDALISNWLLDMKEKWQEIDPIGMHIRYENYHVFIDGNGRSGRMLLWWHQLKLGQTPTLFLNSQKYEKYYPLFQNKHSHEK